MQSRTHTCGELRLADAGKHVRLAGWLENMREVGSNLAFIVVRDFYGTTQITADTEELVKTLSLSPRNQQLQLQELSVREVQKMINFLLERSK